jgi:hypothetical protein
MANVAGVPFKTVYNPEVQTQINDRIEGYKTKVFLATVYQILPGYAPIASTITPENLDEKLLEINEYLAEFIKTYNENPERSAKRNALEQGTNVIAQNILAHLATKVGKYFLDPEIVELKTLTGLMSKSTSPAETTRFFELASLEHLDPLVEELRAEFAADVLEQYPPVQQ